MTAMGIEELRRKACEFIELAEDSSDLHLRELLLELAKEFAAEADRLKTEEDVSLR